MVRGAPRRRGSDWGGQGFVNEAGDQTVWLHFSAGRATTGRTSRRRCLTDRVRDLEAMLAQLREAGVQIEDKVEQEENGWFAWGSDPEGNRFELWQPRT